jgi:hypothetical protein
MKNVEMKLEQAFSFLNKVNSKLDTLTNLLTIIINNTGILNPFQQH